MINFEKPNNIDSLDARSSRKVIRNLQKHYRKLVRGYKIEDLDVKNSLEDKELYEEFLEVSDAYEQIMRSLGVVEDDDKIFGIIPQDYFSEKKRSNWSQDEGYVPYTKRELKTHQPTHKFKKMNYIKRIKIK